MRITKAKVVNGKLVLEDEEPAFPEGSEVTIVFHEEGRFTVTPEEKATLLRSLAEADKGEYVDVEDVLDLS